MCRKLLSPAVRNTHGLGQTSFLLGSSGRPSISRFLSETWRESKCQAAATRTLPMASCVAEVLEPPWGWREGWMLGICLSS